VLASSVLERRPDWMRVSLKLQRRKIVTVVYNTEHVVVFARTATGARLSASTATKIAEVSDANTPQEHELPVGDDPRVSLAAQRVLALRAGRGRRHRECESITLSRDIPVVVRFVVRPLVERAARESMTRTLVALRTRFSS